MSAKRDKRWLKAVGDADLVEFFGDEEFDASEYAKGFYEKNQASRAGARCEELETLKRQTEEALRQEVVRNYRTFMRATEQIQSMERDMERLKHLLGRTQDTLQTFESVRLVEMRPERGKDAPGVLTSPRMAGGGTAAGGGMLTSAARAEGTSKGLRLPQWLDRAPTELEELLLEQKHAEAVKLVQKVRDFSGNVRTATNLGQGVVSIFARVEEMAASLARRLVSEIAETATLTAWGFREHKRNFALLIALGHADEAAVAFVRERSALIRRSLRMAEVTADPLSYVTTVSETFFGQVFDSATAFLKLFCGSKRELERRSSRSRKSAAFFMALNGVRKCGTAPFCRLVVWVDQQIALYAALVGRQLRAVTLGAQMAQADAEEQQQRRQGGGYGGNDASRRSLQRSSLALRPGAVRLGPMASALFSMVSLMMEEAFAQAGRLDLLGFPVGVSLAARLAPDLAAFMESYVQQVESNLVDVVGKELFKPREYRLVPPEALHGGGGDDDDIMSDDESIGGGGGAGQEEALIATLTASASVMVREVRDFLDYALVVLEPPPPVDADDGGGGGNGNSERAAARRARSGGKESGGGDRGDRGGGANSGGEYGEEFDGEDSLDGGTDRHGDGADGGGNPAEDGSGNGGAGNDGNGGGGDGGALEACYTRDEFLELQPVIVHSLASLVRRYRDAVVAHVRRNTTPPLSGSGKPPRPGGGGNSDRASPPPSPPLTASWMSGGGSGAGSATPLLTAEQVQGAGICLGNLGRVFVPQMSQWCCELLPEVMDDEETRQMDVLAAELCTDGVALLAQARAQEASA